ncbi:SDR family oxidoreductase [Streptomyces sp. NPDC058657]|uniref:SDR family oxidoreductase n=1 Tax=unclassified Streptomyces TaxID=2593676 RepID=UPI00364F0DCD
MSEAREPADPRYGPPRRGLPEPPAVGASALPPATYRGRSVLVTGGGTGLGKAIAAEFARLGAVLLLVSRDAGHLADAQAELAALGAGVRTATCDIRDPERIAGVFAEHGTPDVLVNSAAANFPVPAEDMSPNAWRAVVDITLTGTWFMTREFGRRHLAAGTPGSVICVGASYAWTGGPGFAHSSAAKAGVKNLVETLAVEWGPYGIQINGLVPGLMPHEDMTADIRDGLRAAGPYAAGPRAAGPGMAGSHAAGPGMAGPRAAGPGMAGSAMAGPDKTRSPAAPPAPLPDAGEPPAPLPDAGEPPAPIPGPGDRPGPLPGALADPLAGLGSRQPALRVGLPRELGWAATFLASPYARYITGHTLVVDGANWQRRGVVSPPVVTVREQLGRGPFRPEGLG